MAEKINILIGDKDYLMNLSNALSSSLGSCCEISSFSDGEVYLSYMGETSFGEKSLDDRAANDDKLSQDNTLLSDGTLSLNEDSQSDGGTSYSERSSFVKKFPLLIASDEDEFQEIITSHGGYKLILRTNEVDFHNGEDNLSIYSPVSVIVEKIHEILKSNEVTSDDDRNAECDEENELEIICIMGFCSVHMRNEIAMEMARNHSMENRVLYINLDEFSSLRNTLSVPLDTDISDALFIYRENGFVYTDKLQSIINSYGGFDLIMPTACPDDLCETDAETFKKLVRDIGENMGYSEIIIDLGCAFYKYWEMIGISDRTYLIFDRREENRQGMLLEYLEKTGRRSYFEKIVSRTVE